MALRRAVKISAAAAADNFGWRRRRRHSAAQGSNWHSPHDSFYGGGYVSLLCSEWDFRVFKTRGTRRVLKLVPGYPFQQLLGAYFADANIGCVVLFIGE